MLHEFLTANRDELIRRCRQKEARRSAASTTEGKDHGVPLFLQQLVDTLRYEQLSLAGRFANPEAAPSPSAIGKAASLHGAQLLRLGYSVDRVVHDYGDVCQAVTEMAIEQKVTIATDEFRTLNRCLDDAIADAVTAFSRDRQTSIDHQAEALQDRLESYLNDQERLIDTAIQAFAAVRTGSIGLSGATGSVLMHTLLELRALAKSAAAAPAATPPSPPTPFDQPASLAREASARAR